MEFHQLRYFVAIAETGSFTGAARRCFVSQPALSQQIQKLEDELGQKLINRLGRKVELTSAGLVFRERAQRILLEVADAARAVSDDENGGRLRLGVLPSIGPYILPALIKIFRQRMPNAVIEINEDFRSAIVDEVMGGKLDLAIATMPPNHPNLDVEELFEEPLLVAMPEGHPLLSGRELRLHDLEGQRLILLGEASSLGLQTRRFFGDNRIQVDVACRCSQVKTMKAMVAAGIGLAIIPKMAVSFEDSGVYYRALTGASPKREIMLVRRRNRFHSRTEDVFTEVVRAFSSKRQAGGETPE